MARQPESKLAKKVKSYLVAQGAFVFNVHGGDSPFQEIGIPDLLCCFRGLFIGLELKLPGEEPSRIQELKMQKIRDADGIAEVVYSVAQVRLILERIE